MVSQAIYLDGFSTTPVAPEVRDVILANLLEPANAGSPHFAGEIASAKVARARNSVAQLIGCDAEEITFTSGATESNNMVLLGLGRWGLETQTARRRIVVSAIEHKAILEPAAALSRMGYEVKFAPVNREGVIDVEALKELVDSTTLLVSTMMVNNETGVIQPIKLVVEIAHAAGAYVHSDIAQAAGKIEMNVHKLDLDYASLSAHKMYGPMGVGALYMSQLAPTPTPLFFGGGQQRGRRPGTEPVALIAGFAVAAEIALRDLVANASQSQRLFQRLLSQLQLHQVRYAISSGSAGRIPGGGSIVLSGISAEDVAMATSKELSLSTGSACTSGQIVPSHVLRAMGIDDLIAKSIIRIFVNRYNTESEVDRAATIIASTVRKLAAATGPVRQ